VEVARLQCLNGQFDAALDAIEAASRLVDLRNDRSTWGWEWRKTMRDALEVKQIRKILESVLLPESVGLQDTLDAILARAQAGVTADAGSAILKQMKSQREYLIPLDDGTALEALDFIRQQVAKRPQPVREAINAAVEREASRAFANLREGDLVELGESWVLYQGTKAASVGAENAADRLLDAGSPELALLWYDRIRGGAGRPVLVAKRAYARALAEASGAVNATPGDKPPANLNAPLKVGGIAVTLGEFLARIPNPTPRPVPPPFPTILAPAWKKQAPVKGMLKVPAERAGRRVEWKGDVPTLLPAASGEALFVNDGRELRRFDRRTGSNTWTAALPPMTGSAAKRESKLAPRMPTPIYGALVQSDLVFCRHADQIESSGFLLCNGLCAVSAVAGNVTWSWRDNPELGDSHAASEPCFAGGVLYLLSRNQDPDHALVHAVALEARSGRLLWRRAIVMGSDGSGTDRWQLEHLAFEMPRPLATPHGIFFSTQMGRAFLLDALTGTVLWMRSYRRAPDDGTAPDRLNNPSLCAEGKIVLAPRDSLQVMALDEASGKLLWERPAAADPVLCGIWKGKIVTAGRGLCLRDLATGNAAGYLRTKALPSLMIGLLNADRLWLAGAESTRRFDLAAMEELAPLPSAGRLVPTGTDAVACVPGSVSVFAAKDGP
jgi:outer membrane protein assembly factor BamB